MKRMFAVVLLMSAAVTGCGSKKESTTPSNTGKAPLETKESSTGGQVEGGETPAAPASDAANPCAAQ